MTENDKNLKDILKPIPHVFSGDTKSSFKNPFFDEDEFNDFKSNHSDLPLWFVNCKTLMALDYQIYTNNKELNKLR